jgi:hypothetical protein
LQIYIRSGCRLQSRTFYLRRPGQQNAADPEPTEAEMRARVVAEEEIEGAEEAQEVAEYEAALAAALLEALEAMFEIEF